MPDKKNNWITEFKDGNMLHTFSDRVKVITSNQGTSMRIYKDGNLITEKSIIYAHEYEKCLLEVAKDAATIQQFVSHD